MPLDYFLPDRPPSMANTGALSAEYKVRRADYGDNYSQRSRDGINNVRHHTTWVWEAATAAQRDYIKGFMDSHAGTDAFYYKHPGDVGYRKWTCQVCDWLPVSGLLFRVSAQVTEEFDLDV